MTSFDSRPADQAFFDYPFHSVQKGQLGGNLFVSGIISQRLLSLKIVVTWTPAAPDHRVILKTTAAPDHHVYCALSSKQQICNERMNFPYRAFSPQKQSGWMKSCTVQYNNKKSTRWLHDGLVCAMGGAVVAGPKSNNSVSRAMGPRRRRIIEHFFLKTLPVRKPPKNTKIHCLVGSQ